MRTTRAEISLDALTHNLRVCSRLAEGRHVFAVVKANGYGHGMVPVARRLAEEGNVTLAVALVDEAVELREAGIGVPILLMFGVEGHDFDPLFEYSLTPTLWSLNEAAALASAARRRGRDIGIHVKIDTGMGRMGIRWSEAEDLCAEIASTEGLRLAGIMSHLSRADDNDTESTGEQIARLNSILDGLRRRQLPVPTVHVANSAGVLGFPEARFGGVRPGIMLYGYDPRAQRRHPDLQPVMRWVSRILYMKKVPPGSPLSYGGSFVTRKESLIATVPVGYGDGYSRHLSNRGFMLVRNTPAPVVGRVCMDLTLLDVTDVPGVEEGDEVVIMGPDEGAPDAWDLARIVDTIPYEILTSVGGRVPRVWEEQPA